jgi:phosphohistidine phosphatase SixA
MLFLVRHAKAGSRHHFAGDDRLRPLTENGRLQAQALAGALARAGVHTLISSPYLRCIETLQPTAKLIRASVATDERLGEGRSYLAVIDLLEAQPDGTALCSHGDVIPETIAALERRGCDFTSAPEWRKASVWVLHRNGGGEITTAHAWPPPDITS